MVDWFCVEHLTDPYLRAWFARRLVVVGDGARPCEVCRREDRLGIPVQDLDDLVGEVIARFYTSADDDDRPPPEGLDDLWLPNTRDVFEEFGFLEAFGLDLANELAQRRVDDPAWFPRPPPEEASSGRLFSSWDAFKEHVQHTSRFLLRPDPPVSEWDFDPDYRPRELLEKIGQLLAAHPNVIGTIDSGTTIYRARTFEREPYTRPRDLVGPPRELAAQGRMNAAGISVLYGALEVETATAEVYDGSEGVVVASLRPLRELQVVDLTRVAFPSVFDPAVPREEFEVSTFLSGFADDVARPVSRDDRRHHEYVPTQYVTEYVRWRLEVSPIDAIVYPSARCPGGHNIVVFVTAEECLSDERLRPVRRRWGERPVLELGAEVEFRRYGSPPLPPGSLVDERRSLATD